MLSRFCDSTKWPRCCTVALLPQPGLWMPWVAKKKKKKETLPTLHMSGISSLFQQTCSFMIIAYQDQVKLPGKVEFRRSQILQLKTRGRYISALMQQARAIYLSRLKNPLSLRLSEHKPNGTFLRPVLWRLGSEHEIQKLEWQELLIFALLGCGMVYELPR